MSVMMLVTPYSEGARAVGNAKIIVQTIPKSSISYVQSYFTANTSGSASGNVQCWPTNFGSTTLAANTLANTPPLSLTGILHFHNHMSDTLSGSTVTARNFYVQLYAGNTVCANSGATVYPPNTALQRVITIATEGNDGTGNTWGGYKEWDVADATVSLINKTGIGFANVLSYQWILTSNSERPWQFTGNFGADVAPITFIYQF